MKVLSRLMLVCAMASHRGFRQFEMLGIVWMRASWHARPEFAETRIPNAFQANLGCVVSDDRVVANHLKKRSTTLSVGLELVFVRQFFQHSVLLLGSAIHKILAEFGVAVRVHPVQAGKEPDLRIV